MEMNEKQARKEGVKAYADGRKKAPALNQAFLIAACKAEVKTVSLLEAYTHGWTIAMLSDGISDETMPSVIEFKKIFNEM